MEGTVRRAALHFATKDVLWCVSIVFVWPKGLQDLDLDQVFLETLMLQMIKRKADISVRSQLGLLKALIFSKKKYVRQLSSKVPRAHQSALTTGLPRRMP